MTGPLLDPGTVVIAQVGGRQQRGVVMLYDQQHSPGTFPVRFSGLWWRKMTANDVTVVAQPASDARMAL